MTPFLHKRGDDVNSFQTGCFRRLLCLLLFSALLCCFLPSANAAAAQDAQTENSNQTEEGKIVYFLTIKEDFSKTTVSYVQRGLEEAEHDHADYVLLEMNASASYSPFAEEIAKMLLNTPLHTVCYINDRAYDGAVLAALSCDDVVVSPGANLGADPQSHRFSALSEEEQQKWQTLFSETLLQSDRTLQTTAASGAVISTAGDLSRLTISANTALQTGIAERESTSIQMLLADYGLEDSVIIEEEKSIPEIYYDNFSSPILSTLLLVLGAGLLALALFATGYGLAGVLGILFLFFYFLNNYQVGATGIYPGLLLAGGLALLMLETLLLDSNGVLSTLGVLFLILAILFITPNLALALIQILLVLLVVVILIMANRHKATEKEKNGENRNIFQRLVLRDATTTEEGYLSQPINIHNYLDKEGVALTSLRPAGAVKIGNERVDVVTEGDFINAGDLVKVIKVDGSSVIVRKI